MSRTSACLHRLWLSLALLLPFAAFAGNPSVALFYGNDLPWDELRAYDIVVVEPGHVADPKPHSDERSSLFAYVAVGEASADRPYLKDMPDAWKLGENKDWGSVVIDQAQPEWPAFFVEHLVKPLWDAGYRGFFLDTLDSFHLIAKTDAERARQQAGLAAAIRALKQRYPQARLIFNRGFEILPQVHDLAYAVAAESLYQGWDPARQQYRAVPAADREWLLGQLKHVKNDYGLHVISIDYVPPEKRELARKTAAAIRAQGFIPWVSTPQLDMLGVGEVEVMPRKVLMVRNTGRNEYDLIETSALKYAAMPLNYLGYAVDYADARKPLPDHALIGRYAGIVVWLDQAARAEGPALIAWLERQIKEGVPVALIGEAAFLLDSGKAERFGLRYTPSAAERTTLRITHQDALVGFETPPVFDRSGFFTLQAQGGQPLLTVTNAQGESQDGIALTPWGGYALNPYVLVDLPSFAGSIRKEDGGMRMRWVINPIEFLRQALHLPQMPVPVTTTESGRRLLMMHMDGDGFVSRGQFPGAPYAGEVLLQEVLKKYPLPATISVIQGEIAPDGLYPDQSPALEKVAREIFELPHVEIASHSFSHPFIWQKASNNPQDEGYHLKIPDYDFDLRREIAGSIDYIDRRLAPPGKKAQVMLWTGDCNVGSDALRMASVLGLESMNGGETLISRTDPSLTLVSPLGIPKGDYFQVYAPNQNENVYTQNWTGPFYGFERVIETFEMTETPYRLKPIDIYFHTYSASKPASLKALQKVIEWAQVPETMTVHISEYVRKVHDFNHLVIARTPDGWLVRGRGELRELRAPLTLGYPALGDDSIAGFRRNQNDQYLHLADNEARIRFSPKAAAQPFLHSANARVARAQHLRSGQGSTLVLSLHGYLPLKFVLGGVDDRRCTMTADGRAIRPDRKVEDGLHFSLRERDIDELRIECTQ
ncbi:MAG: endo alpha-1,4 polygalactosaminidase [Pseudomonadota bacterium]